MNSLIDLIVDNQTTGGRLVTTAVVVAVAVLLSLGLGLVLRRRIKDPLARYHARKINTYAIGALALVVIGIIWRPFAGQIGVFLGLLGAGFAFALQEVIGATAGWVNIISGGIFQIGDRIEMGGVRGDVIDISLLRTKLMEIGSPVANDTWVHGRQYTGRIVTVSNKKTFTDPVFNFSSPFEYIWEELVIPVSHRSNWQLAETIMREEAEAASRTEGAEKAMRAMMRNYPVPHTEVEPRVFARVTDNWMELSARFIVPVRTARTAKDLIYRKVRERLDDAGIEIASATVEAALRFPDDLDHSRDAVEKDHND